MKRIAYDVLVVGSGVAALTTALYCASVKLNPLLVQLPRSKKRSVLLSLHPGLESIFAMIQMSREISSVAKKRPAGFWRKDGPIIEYINYSDNENESWNGYLINENSLVSILKAKVEFLQIHTIETERIEDVIINGKKLVGLKFNSKANYAPLIIDASGDRNVLSKYLDLKYLYGSPRLVAQYVELETFEESDPIFEWLEHGWRWSGGATLQCKMQLELDLFKTTVNDHISQRCDVTWRYLPCCAGDGYFVVGDAALRLDPASGNGILRSMATAIKAVHCHITSEHYTIYRNLISQWIAYDSDQLAKMYFERHQDIPWLAQRQWRECPIAY